MRRWAIGAVLLVALAGLVIAFTLSTDTIRECPRPGFGLRVVTRCLNMPDSHPGTRFAIGAVAVLPAVILLGAFRRNRVFRVGFLVAGIAVAIGLWWIGGLVPNDAGDCPPYPQCYSIGHPYAGPAALVLLITLIVALWLWVPNLDDPRTTRERATDLVD